MKRAVILAGWLVAPYSPRTPSVLPKPLLPARRPADRGHVDPASSLSRGWERGRVLSVGSSRASRAGRARRRLAARRPRSATTRRTSRSAPRRRCARERGARRDLPDHERGRADHASTTTVLLESAPRGGELCSRSRRTTGSVPYGLRRHPLSTATGGGSADHRLRGEARARLHGQHGRLRARAGPLVAHIPPTGAFDTPGPRAVRCSTRGEPVGALPLRRLLARHRTSSTTTSARRAEIDDVLPQLLAGGRRSHEGHA